MSDALEKAEAAAREAAESTDIARLVAVALATQQATQQHQPAAAPPPRPEFNATKWVVIGGVVVSVALAGALVALAIAIAACCSTGCFLILRSMWRAYLNNR
ncbi:MULTISPECIES: hypothetical protein [Streptomyces rochei group]|uniref:hypothetical protein n=1 Tax=Streptomyces rochei group TaxID=2867164 RepID=UPI0018764F93|nr:hypothetical protein [Streptomyces vinaceusdrappus]GHC28868.1 hypothetical protein GCM10010308_52670 [Streptomyces vinaceusdrappus]